MSRGQVEFECDTFSALRFDHPPEAPHVDPPEEISEKYSLIFVGYGGYGEQAGFEHKAIIAFAGCA